MPDSPRRAALLGRRVVVWGVFFGLLYLLRAFFPLLLLTFIITYAASHAAQSLTRRFPTAPRRLLVSLVFGSGVGALVGLGFLLGPLVQDEQQHFVERFPEMREGIARWVEEARSSDPTLMSMLDPDGTLAHDVRSFNLSDLRRPEEEKRAPLPILDDVSPLLLDFARVVARIVGTILLSLLFSLLILLDLPKLTSEVEAIRVSRIGWLYQEVRGTVVEFGATLGRVMEAQVVIATVNTLLTFLGLAGLGVPSKFLLSTIVFFCSFIPVLGVFLSTVPICLIALANGGMGLVLRSIAMVVVVHAVEAYVLNPRITGSHVRLNPVLVLAVLVVGEYLFGLWGLLLGVPVAVTLLRKTRDMVRSEAT
jgi:predicted PurR-regulated permease PerM